jgi:uncharacterized protein YjbJ (UPF0337 family)
MAETEIDTDEAKGRAKEAAGVLTGNQRLKNEGRMDQARSSAKHAVDRVVDGINAVVDRHSTRNKG